MVRNHFQPLPSEEEQLKRMRAYKIEVHKEGALWIATRGNCVGALDKGPDGLRIDGPAALRIGTELGQLMDGGYQKFFKTPTRKVPALAEQLKELHEFAEALSEALGDESYYNLSLGTVSTTYHYDRVKGRANQQQ